MVGHASLLVTLVSLIDRLPHPTPSRRGPGRPTVYTDHLFLKALVIMLIRHLQTAHGLLAVLDQTTAEMRALRAALTFADGQVLATTQSGPYPHTDAGVEVRRVFHALRSRAIENVNEQF
jgi:hypothetical protein